MRWLLQIPAWLLFVLLVAIPAALQAAAIPLSIRPITSGLMTVVWALLTFGWIWSIGIESNRRLPPDLRKSTVWFTGGYAFALLYLAVAVLFVFPAPGIMAIMMFPHLLAMFFIFYGLWFSARQFMTLRRMERVAALDVLGPFFGMWFFPIGMWLVQPRVNEILGSRDA
jgi:hypothetical protein